jgi:predicted nucleic acid-binding protein
MAIESLWSLDTNVLVYATGLDTPPQKKRVANNLLERLFASNEGCLAGQVLSEYLSVVVRKKLMPHLLALETVNVWSQVAKVLPAPAHVYEQAWQLTVNHQYQVWDALIIAICAEHGVKTLYSEDAGSLKRPLGVHVVNPFAELETEIS